MKSEKLMDAITNIDEDLLEEARKEPTAEEKKAAQRRGQILSPSFLRAVCAVLVLGILTGSVLLFTRPGRQNQETEPYAADRTESVQTGTEESQPSVITGGVTPLPSESDTQPSETPAATAPDVPETTAYVPSDEWRDAALAAPEYPEEWTRQEREEHYRNAGWGEDPQKDDPTRIRRAAAGNTAQTWRSFFADMMLLLLSDETEDNAVMSPVNLFMVTAMLAEVTAGETRQEILDALSVDSLETLREQARKIWELCYYDDGAEKTVLGNSLWLSDQWSYQEETVQTLAKKYYASVFSGDMASPQYEQLLRDWTDFMTGGVLKDQTDQMQFEPGTVFELVSTVYCQSDWAVKFKKEDTAPGVFHGSRGDVTADFMHSHEKMQYLKGTCFTAVCKTTFQGRVWFVLPNEGCFLQDIMREETFQSLLAYSYLMNEETWDRQDIGLSDISHGTAMVDFSLPKVDIRTDGQDLKESLRKLNIRRCFDPEQADFSAIAEGKGLYLGKAEQSSRLKMDEKGITAASFATMITALSAPWEKISFVLDRPFFVLVTDNNAIPLFAAVVNEP